MAFGGIKKGDTRELSHRVCVGKRKPSHQVKQRCWTSVSLLRVMETESMQHSKEWWTRGLEIPMGSLYSHQKTASWDATSTTHLESHVETAKSSIEEAYV